MGVTEELMKFVSEAKFEDLPAPVVAEAKRHLLEGVCTITFGSGLGLGRSICEALYREGEPQEAVFIGTDKKGSLRTAAMYNATMGDMQDSCGGYYYGVVHPAKNVTPAALTYASAEGKNGKDLIVAMIMGIEAYARIDLAIAGAHTWRGHYNDGTIGCLGAAISVGKLAGLSKDGLRSALGNAGMLTPATIGGNSMYKAIGRATALGMGAANGIFAVELAQAGVSGPPDILECPGGFSQALSGVTDLSKVVQGLGREWESLKFYYKPFCGCRLTHSGRQCAQAFKKQTGVRPEDIDKVIWRMPAGNLIVTDHYPALGAPVSEHSSSAPYLIANVFLYDDVGPGCFSEKRLNDPKVHEMAGRVAVVADAELTKAAEGGYDKSYSTRIEIFTRDGNKYAYSAEYVKGDPYGEWRMTDKELKDKFRTYCAGVLSPDRVEDAIEMIARLDEVDVAELVGSLSTG